MGCHHGGYLPICFAKHMDVSAKISKWIVQLQEFDYTIMVEESTRAALADILTHQFKEKKGEEGI